MARIRTIKPEFWADEKMAPLDPIDRLVFLGLISMADDCGRLLDNVKIIDAFIFPSTSHTCRDALATLSRMGRVVRGNTSSGQPVVQIANWTRHQRVDKPNNKASLPEIISPQDVTPIRDAFATDSRDIRDAFALRPTTYDQRSTTDDDEQTATANSVGGNLPEEYRTDYQNLRRSVRLASSLDLELQTLLRGTHPQAEGCTPHDVGRGIRELILSGRPPNGLANWVRTAMRNRKQPKTVDGAEPENEWDRLKAKLRAEEAAKPCQTT